MPKVVTQWAGHLFGTNTGKFFLEFDKNESEDELTGHLRINDDVFGISQYVVKGTFSEKLIFSGEVVFCEENVKAGKLTAEATLDPKGILRGTWETTIGTKGTFIAAPQNSETQNINSNKIYPEQIHNATKDLGALRFCLTDLKNLIVEIKKDFSSDTKVIITYSIDGHHTTQYSDEFMKEAEKRGLGELKELRIYIQELEFNNINRSISVELGVNDSNKITVSGSQETWVIGKLTKARAWLKRYESYLVTKYKKFGLNVNAIIFLTMLVFVPSIQTKIMRAYFVGLTFIILILLLFLHKSCIPIFEMKTNAMRQSWFARKRPAFISFIGTILSGVIIALISNYFTGAHT